MNGKTHFAYLLIIGFLVLGGWWKDIQKDAAYVVIEKVVDKLKDCGDLNVLVKGFVVDSDGVWMDIGERMYKVDMEGKYEEVYDSLRLMEYGDILLQVMDEASGDKKRSMKMLEENFFIGTNK